jgi:hypothetical protein
MVLFIVGFLLGALRASTRRADLRIFRRARRAAAQRGADRWPAWQAEAVMSPSLPRFPLAARGCTPAVRP